MSVEKRYMYKSTLKGVYGLTDKLIEQLGPPDKIVPNPHYRSAAPSLLYLIERVEDWVENHPDEVAAAKVRSERAKAVSVARWGGISAERKAQAEKLKTWAQSVEIVIYSLPRIEERLKQAVDDHLNNLAIERPGEKAPLCRRTITNFVRHRRSNYEKLLGEMEERLLEQGHSTCGGEVYDIIKRRVNHEIAKKLMEVQREL